MKKFQIDGKTFIRQDGLYYNLTDLFRLTTLNGIRLEPWAWAQSENRTREISRRGWLFKSSWGKQEVLVRYARYLTPGLYRDVQLALGLITDETVSSMRPRVDRNSHADKMQATLRTRPSSSRSSSSRRSEPDDFTQMVAMQSVIDSTPSRSHDSHYSHHCSSSSSSWSGDSGSSDSGSSGGCD